jgi:hypothetical protein
LLKNSHLAAVLESRLVRRSAACAHWVLRLRGAFCGCDDLTIFEQPEFFQNLLDGAGLRLAAAFVRTAVLPQLQPHEARKYSHDKCSLPADFPAVFPGVRIVPLTLKSEPYCNNGVFLL